MNTKDIPVLGKGVYTLAEAARLAQVPSARISRWIRGYERAGVWYEPLLESELPPGDDMRSSVISFADLMEVKLIALFYEHGVRIQTVREALERARSEFGLERPFSSRKFQTDGKRLFLELREACPDDKGLLDIVSRQRVFKNIVEPTFKNIDFEGVAPVRWWPLGRRNAIVVDPARSLGRPIDNASGVPVDAIVDAIGDECLSEIESRDIATVATLFDLPKATVRQASEFARRYAA